MNLEAALKLLCDPEESQFFSRFDLHLSLHWQHNHPLWRMQGIEEAPSRHQVQYAEGGLRVVEPGSLVVQAEAMHMQTCGEEAGDSGSLLDARLSLDDSGYRLQLNCHRDGRRLWACVLINGQILAESLVFSGQLAYGGVLARFTRTPLLVVVGLSGPLFMETAYLEGKNPSKKGGHL
jgi:hypothetical protein